MISVYTIYSAHNGVIIASIIKLNNTSQSFIPYFAHAAQPTMSKFLVFIVEQILVGIDAVVTAVTIYSRRLGGVHMACENVTSSTKPEVGSITSQSHQRRTEATRDKNLMKFGCVVSEICERIDGQTDKHKHNTSQPSRGRHNLQACCKITKKRQSKLRWKTYKRVGDVSLCATQLQ